MTEYVGQKPLFDQYLELKAENERLRKLVAGLPKCCTCGGIIKPEQGGQCMPCLGEETLPDSAQETSVTRCSCNDFSGSDEFCTAHKADAVMDKVRQHFDQRRAAETSSAPKQREAIHGNCSACGYPVSDHVGPAAACPQPDPTKLSYDEWLARTKECPACHGQGCEPHECDDGRLIQGPPCERCEGACRIPL